MITAAILIAALIAAVFDAKATDTHRLQVRRLYRKIKKVERANQLTALDAMFYVNQIGK